MSPIAPVITPAALSSGIPEPLASVTESISVYISDDDQQFAFVVRDLLQQERGLVIAGSSGSVEQTLADLATLRPDVLILDLYMPEGESLECVADVRRLVPGIKVLVVTGGGWSDQQVASVLAGANGFLYKPFTSSNLSAAVRLVHSGKAFFDFQALTHALTFSSEAKAPSTDVLSPEDREFLGLIRQGLTNAAIASLWNTGIKAVYQRRYRLKTKLGLHSARELANFAASSKDGQ